MSQSGNQKLVRLSKSCLGNAEREAVLGVLDREYLGMGCEVQLFEQALSSFFDRPAVCVVNGTAALHLALQSIGVGDGDEVLVPSLTYVASFQAISATGAVPVACDVFPETLTLDWCDAERRISSRTKAVMPVHYAGGVGAIEDVYTFARKYGLRVVEDAAHAFGTEYGGKRIGGFGDIACFSFDGIKNITSGEGGCIVTDDEQVLKKLRDMRLLGVEKDTDRRYSGERSWEFDVTAQGWRYHMSNIMAAIGLEQLKRFPEFAEKRKALAKLYDRHFATARGISPLHLNYDLVVPHIYVVRVDNHMVRDEIRESLGKLNIQTGVHYMPNHWLSYYQSTNVRLPHVEDAYQSLLSLPMHPDLDSDDVERVIFELKRCVNNV